MRQLAIIVVLLSTGTASSLFAQGPLAQGPLRNRLRTPPAATLPRLPNDQIEGTIWEYKGTLKQGADAEEEAPVLEGRFRLEGKAVLDVNRRVKVPPAAKVRKAIAAIRQGEGAEISVPARPQVKRLGEYRRLSNGKIRLDLDDEQSLHGLMLIWLKPDTSDVWLGTYREKENQRTVRTWIVELRPIED